MIDKLYWPLAFLKAEIMKVSMNKFHFCIEVMGSSTLLS
jgi:hypothetical protein